MNHLPKLSPGVQRIAGVGGVRLCVATAQARSKNTPAFFNPRSNNDLWLDTSPVLGGGRSNRPLSFELPVYGNYCGPGFGDPTGCTPAKDEVDAVCCRHDQCYGEHGYFNCGCDCDLVKSMPSAIANTPSAEGKAKGAAIMAFFANTPCQCFDPIFGWPIPIPGGPTKCLLSPC